MLLLLIMVNNKVSFDSFHETMGIFFFCYKWSVYLPSVGIDIVSSRLHVNAKEIYKRIPKQHRKQVGLSFPLYTCV
jgi:hypothetical protein